MQVTAAYATATNEVLLQHYAFVDSENINDFYPVNILDFIKQTAMDQPGEEQLQDLQKRPALRKALTEVTKSCVWALQVADSALHCLCIFLQQGQL